MKTKLYATMPIITILYATIVSFYFSTTSAPLLAVMLIVTIPLSFKGYKKVKNTEDEEEKLKIVKEMKKSFYLDIIIIILLPILYMTIDML